MYFCIRDSVMDSGIEKICVIPLRFHSKHPFPTRNVIESSYRIRKIISSPLIPRSVRQQFCFEIILNDYLKKKKKRTERGAHDSIQL